MLNFVKRARESAGWWVQNTLSVLYSSFTSPLPHPRMMHVLKSPFSRAAAIWVGTMNLLMNNRYVHVVLGYHFLIKWFGIDILISTWTHTIKNLPKISIRMISTIIIIIILGWRDNCFIEMLVILPSFLLTFDWAIWDTSACSTAGSTTTGHKTRMTKNSCRTHY
jgi:hypothetical protein